MRAFLTQTAVLVLALSGVLAVTRTAHAGEYLTDDEEARCMKELKIRGPVGIDEVATRGFAWGCIQAFLDKQATEFAALRKSAHNHGRQKAAAYDALLAAFMSYHTQQLAYENRECGGGNACGVFSALEEFHNNRDFLIVTEEIEGDTFPLFTAVDLDDADSSLNKTYQEALKAIACSEAMIGEEHPCDADLRSVERTWIRYRDAWVSAAAILWPEVPADSLRTLLTRQRTLELLRF